MKAEDYVVEIMILTLLAVGFLLSLWAGVVGLKYAYAIIVLCGVYFGRMWYYRNRENKGMLVFYFTVAAFLVGFIIGGYYTSSKTLIALFALGIIASYWIHVWLFTKS